MVEPLLLQKGGTTRVTVTPPSSDEMLEGWADCSEQDMYNYKLGLTIALGRALTRRSVNFLKSLEKFNEEEGFGEVGELRPDPLFMLIKNMTQTQHGDRNYAGNLRTGGGEFLVEDIEEAEEYIRENFADGDVGTLISIERVGNWRKEGEELTNLLEDEAKATEETTLAAVETTEEDESF